MAEKVFSFDTEAARCLTDQAAAAFVLFAAAVAVVNEVGQRMDVFLKTCGADFNNQTFLQDPDVVRTNFAAIWRATVSDGLPTHIPEQFT